MKLVDPDGEDFIGALVGCLVGAATEIVSQTIANGMENLSNGEVFFKDWSKKIDWADVGISAVEGTLDGLLPGTGKLAGELIGDVAKAAIDWKGENKSVMGSGWGIVGFSKDPKEFACDLVANMVSTGFSHVSGLGNLAVERNHFDVSSMMFESALKGSVLGLLGTINKMVKKDYITSRHLNVQTNFIVGPAVLKRIEP